MNSEILRLGKVRAAGRRPWLISAGSGSTAATSPSGSWNPPTLTTPARRDSALAVQRAAGPGDEEGGTGLRVIRLERLTAQFSPLTVSTPDHRPISAEIDTLATRVSDPGVELVQARGRIRTPHDSLIFEITRGALPHSRFTGAGAITWPDGPILFDFALQMSEVDLATCASRRIFPPCTDAPTSRPSRSRRPGRPTTCRICIWRTIPLASMAGWSP
jgi:hypothetical protein